MITPESVRPFVGIVVAYWGVARGEAHAVRYDVLVIEQGVPVELEWDERGDEYRHALVHDTAGRAVATGCLLPDGYIGRMVVRKEVRDTGVGACVLEALIDKARSLGYPELILNAQTHAIPLYSHVDSAAESEEFEEAGIPYRIT